MRNRSRSFAFGLSAGPRPTISRRMDAAPPLVVNDMKCDDWTRFVRFDVSESTLPVMMSLTLIGRGNGLVMLGRTFGWKSIERSCAMILKASLAAGLRARKWSRKYGK